jgi:hypothetical protein
MFRLLRAAQQDEIWILPCLQKYAFNHLPINFRTYREMDLRVQNLNAIYLTQDSLDER